MSAEQPPSSQSGQPRLRTVPTTLRDANAFVAAHHRHHKPVRGHTSSTAVVDDQGTVRGVAIIGRPLARKIDHRQVCEVLRVATDGCANACSALYGAACRIAKAFGYAHVLTYTLGTEPGTSLRAAGWKPVALTDGGSWSREGREREDAHPLIPKVRWECRCSSAPAIELEEAA
jgi:hypothetical protein